MVYFECQKCNETVKKPKLAKHLLSCQSSYVSCIDCLKVFAWDEWEKHTSCVSEAQKYQGHMYQAKESSNKGQAKQNTWTQNVVNRIEDPSSNIAPQTKALLEKLLGFDNIPRKQKPFGNFVKNSLKIWDERKINEIWEVIASAAAASKAAPAPAAAAPAPVCQPCAKPEQQRWAGWKRALDSELQEAGGELPWKRLRDAVVTKYRESGQPNGISEDELGFRALAEIPEKYLSAKDELVRLPEGASVENA
mmetsp:Transcript_15459/g.27686  ORF Transcript_15459/g.27686 Transcript_15459/m.27686 type:complete len:250 (-) Transcript_15459:60-809(-)